MGSPLPNPVVVSTSQVWDNDGGGVWSTFILNIGTPPQPSRVIISTSSSETWVVGPEGCPQKYGSNCQEDRGLLFDPNKSSSWTANKNFSLFLEESLEYEGNGQFGFDTVKLGYTGSGEISLEQQTVAAIASPDYWLGFLGLDKEPSNFTNMNEPRPSFLDNLYSRSIIPSLSWGYTAGANYRQHKPQGSLTLGGYDNSRYTFPNLTFKMYDDVTRRFMVDLKSITNTLNPTSSPIPLQPIPLAIDSTVPHLYLPKELCEHFEETFGVEWASGSNSYVVNATQHSFLQRLNPNITLTIADSRGSTLNITFPYSAFSSAVPTNTTSPGSRPFSLRRAMNDTQYTLGRTFLQEVYMMTDYQRSTFTIAPCTWPSTFTQNIKTILPPSTADAQVPTPEAAPKFNKRLYLIPAIIIPILSTLSLLFLFRYIKHRKKQHDSPGVSPNTSSPIKTRESDEFRKAELETTGNEIKELDGIEFRAEIEGKELQCELDSGEIHEMPHEGTCTFYKE